MMDLILEAWVSGIIELAKWKWMVGRGSRWRPGRKLKLLFAGYNGTRNTGADVRVEEMLRQIRHILGADHTEFSIMSQNFALSKGYFQGTRQVHLPDVFPPFLAREVPQHDGVVACEGSMFKSKFANALTTMMIGSLGISSAQNKLSVGYGAEAGQMDPLLARMCRRYCAQSLIITRNVESMAILRELGISSELGTDTAWTFEPLPPDYGSRELRRIGWDGRTPVLAVCPINPFWWPVRAAVGKYALRLLAGAYKDSHYRTIYFHNSGRAVTQKYRRYLKGMSQAIQAYRRDRQVFPVLIAMERLDAKACRHMTEFLGPVPILTSDDYDMYQLVSILRCCHRLVSSRYHGIVTAMPALFPSAGVTMDERIRNLMQERGHSHLLLQVDDADLEPRLLEVLRCMDRESEEISQGIGCTVAKNIKMMARMGVYMEGQVRRNYPDFPLAGGVRSWEEYLPPLSPPLHGLMERFSS